MAPRCFAQEGTVDSRPSGILGTRLVFSTSGPRLIERQGGIRTATRESAPTQFERARAPRSQKNDRPRFCIFVRFLQLRQSARRRGHTARGRAARGMPKMQQNDDMRTLLQKCVGMPKLRQKCANGNAGSAPGCAALPLRGTCPSRKR